MQASPPHPPQVPPEPRPAGGPPPADNAPPAGGGQPGARPADDARSANDAPADDARSANDAPADDAHLANDARPTEADDPERSLVDTLTAAIAHGAGAVLLCSFQKEESVLLDELIALGGTPPVRIVTIDTGVLFEETLQTWKAFEDHFGITIEVQDATAASASQAQWTGPDHCCSAAKVAALERALSGAEAWITGIRRTQGPTRAQVTPIELDPQRGLTKYNPLAHWTDQDLWRRIHARSLPYHPLHDRGYDSIGCSVCTQPGAGREGRWAGTDKTECGLHLPLPVSIAGGSPK